MDFRPNPMSVGVCLFGFFVFYVNFVVLEVIGVPLCQQQLGDKKCFYFFLDLIEQKNPLKL